MANDSSTGGPLQPEGTAPLEGQALYRFLQQWLVGVSGLPGNRIVPRWQTEPPNIPANGTPWMAFGITRRRPQGFAAFVHQPDADGGTGADQMQRHEFLDLLLSFYDTGIDGQADAYMAVTRDGLQVSQNNEVLYLNGFGFTSTGEPIPVPSLVSQTWLYRVDLPLTLSREILRTYPIRNLTSIQISVSAESGEDEPVESSVNVDLP